MSKVDHDLMKELLVPSSKMKVSLTKESVLTKKEVEALIEKVNAKYQFNVIKVSNCKLTNLYLLELKDNKKLYIDSTGDYLIYGLIIDTVADQVLDNMLG